MTAIEARPVAGRPPAPWDPVREHRFVTSDGTALHVRSSGPAAAPLTLVLVHGWTQDHRTWDRVVDEFDRMGDTPARMLRYDLRGHGASAPARPGTATIEQLADDLAELLAARVPDGPLVLAGHSMGGMTIMALAERHPELVERRVAGVAFVATSCGSMDRITLGLPGVLGTGAAAFERRLAALLLRHRKDRLPLRPATVYPGTRLLVFGRRPRRADVRDVAAQLLVAHPASVGGFQQSISRHDRRVALARLRGKPAVVLAGDRDRLCPLPHAEAIAAELPEAGFVRYPGAGHMLAHERAAGVAARLVTLVRTVAERQGRRA
ncbi:Pimeloyl-ACP methyl ester carboxylesterase [Amycolatopsis arida]|uniref:Pimeloyl-ACP methyl ester carboxylesterase n=1 Tax=Amycolatopsis arida TaxID=587909 RepID=A0A1I5WED3_9PSEU|nr:alpha/beta hydrolase [Amycolatopsis arida]TDX92241.1 pimeloyl-ACP methyl ester carboxylesterase [Amycolatopsis arida]SFQ18102.1 Pimeloyl-ACP methyl ester carboxylesterase [Amycolatopsis arida]